ncbi:MULTISPECIES: hypothetical protein [unclassified Serratia (in: enterobacteria)]|nr:MULTISPECIES: hypothetical protein [unclassified Serratia (in: enterobacteria)]
MIYVEIAINLRQGKRTLTHRHPAMFCLGDENAYDLLLARG